MVDECSVWQVASKSPSQRNVERTSMSRIGKIPVPVPAGVKVAVADGTVAVEGPLGKLKQTLLPQVAVKFDEAGQAASWSPATTTPGRPRRCTG